MKSAKRYFISLLLLFIVFSLVKNIFDYRRKLNFYQSYKNEYEKERKNNISLKTKILQNTDSFEVEKTIRDKLNLSKNGEVTVIIPDPTPTPIIITPIPLPIPRQWLDIFFQN